MSGVLVAFVIAKGKKELRRVDVAVDGTAATVVAEPVAEPDITFTCTEADWAALRDGTLDLSVGFMRGQVKMAGDFGRLLHFLPLTAGVSPQVNVSSLL